MIIHHGQIAQGLFHGKPSCGKKAAAGVFILTLHIHGILECGRCLKFKTTTS